MQGVPWSRRGLHVITKPIGPRCNLRCAYCFYLEKERLYPGETAWAMSEATLDALVRQYIQAQPPQVTEIDFAFQGGEPTLLGLDFFRKVVALERQYAPAGLRVHNSLQTNGILLDDAWCAFLREHDFLVGLSLDGPPRLHDVCRRDPSGGRTAQRVLEALERLRRHGVVFNVLACIHRHNGDHAPEVYRFFRDLGVEHIQFIPIVQRAEIGEDGFPSAGPDSVLPEQFGHFLTTTFDEWLAHDVGHVFVRDFDQALGAWVGGGASLCVYSPECGRAVAVEHNGDVYPCDHFVDAEHRLGNLHETSLAELADSTAQRRFGQDKANSLPEDCRQCPFLFACNGGCPKDRFARASDGHVGLNYLCAGFRQFFAHVDAPMRAMAAELRAGGTAAMAAARLRAASGGRPAPAAKAAPRRNDPCPCGSGKKFKYCCMRK